MILKDKKILITGILTDKSIAYATAQVAIENGAEVVATGFGKGLRITERIVKRLPGDIQVYEMDIQNEEQVVSAANSIKENFGNLDGILHAIAFSPTEAMGGNFMNTSIEDASTSFEVSAFSLKTLSQGFKSLLNNPASIVALDFDNSQSWPGYDWQGVAKSGLQSVVRYLAYYMGEDGVRVNAVSAGPLATTAAKNIPGFGEMNDEWDQKAPLGWDSKDAIPVAKVVNFLLSEYSEAVSGEIIHADGGAHSVGGTMLP
jgi:enoyl-[acyl-carrier protein] reductase I